MEVIAVCLELIDQVFGDEDVCVLGLSKREK